MGTSGYNIIQWGLGKKYENISFCFLCLLIFVGFSTFPKWIFRLMLSWYAPVLTAKILRNKLGKQPLPPALRVSCLSHLPPSDCLDFSMRWQLNSSHLAAELPPGPCWNPAATVQVLSSRVTSLLKYPLIPPCTSKDIEITLKYIHILGMHTQKCFNNRASQQKC